MLSSLGKFLFVVSALAPLTFAYTIDLWVHRTHWDDHSQWLYLFRVAVTLSIALPVICALIVIGIIRYGHAEPLKTTEVKTADKKVLTFLLVYLLPIISKEFVGIYSSPILACYVLAIIAWA